MLPATPPRADSLPWTGASPRSTSRASRQASALAARGQHQQGPWAFLSDDDDDGATLPPNQLVTSTVLQGSMLGAGFQTRHPLDNGDDDKLSQEKDAICDADIMVTDTDLLAAVNKSYRPASLDLSQLPSLRNSLAFSDATPPTPLTGSSTTTPPTKVPLIQPTISLLFSLTTRASTLSVVIPAIILSIVSGLIPPYMTELLGTAFQAFTTYSITVADPLLSAGQLQAARDALLSSTKNSSIQFCALAVGILITSTASVGLWVLNGERVVRALRREVFMGIGKREMAWFDLGMGSSTASEASEAGEGGEGAGGLMGRFARETDNVRLAASQTIGLIIQYFTSFLACLVLSFYRDALLTLVILSSIPLVILIVAVTEKLASGLVTVDRDLAAKSAGRADRVLGAIPTIKAFNSQARELADFSRVTDQAYIAYSKLHFIWGIRGGATQFILLSMFVQGFWFGSYLVNAGKSSAASVNTCFWACLLAATYLQLCVPSLVVLEKGKMGMADLLELATELEEEISLGRARDSMISVGSSSGLHKRNSTSSAKNWKLNARKGSTTSLEPFAGQGVTNGSTLGISNLTTTLNQRSSLQFITEADEDVLSLPLSPLSNLPSPPLPSPITPNPGQTLTFVPLAARTRKRIAGSARQLRKLRPLHFSGELSLRNITFYYPSRPYPAPPALKAVNLYLAARETTYIVGGSGSGKSTVGNLLLGLYHIQAADGKIEVDEQGLEWIDQEWLRGHIACVSQGASVIFDGSVHDNVAIGVVGQLLPDGSRRDPSTVTREEVIQACRGALVHEFVRDLPEGYDTILSGEKGASLSGGQRQRLAIARAWIRDPTVLILDEATSALDATSRLLVSEAVKQWRQNRTTIIITHDLTPIGPHDFVYVMTDGCVVEQGYRSELEANPQGAFCTLAGMTFESTGADDGLLQDHDDELEVLGDDIYASYYQEEEAPISRQSQFFGGGLFPPSGDVMAQQGRQLGIARKASANFSEEQERRRSTHSYHSRRATKYGAPPPSYDYSSYPAGTPQRDSTMSLSTLTLTQAATKSASRRPGGQRIKHKTMIFDAEFKTKLAAKSSKLEHVTITVDASPPVATMGVVAIMRKYYPTIPNKPLFWFGIACSLVVGATTPIFSSLLSKLMANLGNPAAGSLVITTSLLILLIAFVDGTCTLLKFYALERCGMGWIAALRIKTLALILQQDKSFFDREENSASNLVNILIKDAEDARTLVGTVIGSLFVVVSMIIIGLAWAFIVGWELTLVGVGLAPVFVLATRLQAGVVSKYEAKNKRMREDISKRFHQVVSNIRAIRAMSIKSVFDGKFEEAIERAYVGGAAAAPFSGFGFGLGAALTYIAEALMFYVGAILIANGRYTFAKMLEVFTLIIFSITFSAQIMTYLPAMTKSIHAAIDFTRLLDLDSETQESQGRMTFPITGHIKFDNVIFAYPSRPNVPVLKGMSFEVKPGECVGIVGASGSGKSTITALLQRLYEPDFGSILLDGRPLERMDVKYLRDHIAVVSQHPALFDMTIAENISYGCKEGISDADIIQAAHRAHVHDFITSLPQGYQTMLGENASLISGGQAQRLQIARALIQPRELLILDEATSALDSTNQANIMATVNQVKVGRTTLIVTHKLAVMEMCDRLIVVGEGGRILETGTVAELRAKSGGAFASMASAGEWSG